MKDPCIQRTIKLYLKRTCSMLKSFILISFLEADSSWSFLLTGELHLCRVMWCEKTGEQQKQWRLSIARILDWRHCNIGPARPKGNISTVINNLIWSAVSTSESSVISDDSSHFSEHPKKIIFGIIFHY